MDLWIRDQNKTNIRKVDNIFITCFEHIPEYTINTNNDSAGMTFCLGSYKTKERAMQILDTIQNMLMPILKMPTKEEMQDAYENFAFSVAKGMDTKIVEQANSFVYQMPEE